ncbi:DUF3889 domain-containing protein [Oceanobacillus polygoni]|uniref:Rare lipoprotein A n=1 Tax=Oceanobacillus polygoni TaxID=1235259 RepID=A0A9X0YVD9_9BACI|nr:DUF3889 domain-containing protein [Oceanobacillus polygoni]MBP2078020.1 rare lipoprotein A [Oceanobacillus polygoni]
MNPNYPYWPNRDYYEHNPYQTMPYGQQSTYDYEHAYPTNSNHFDRQQSVRGQATWTDGGQVTKCGMAWSDNAYMTAAVGETSPYTCGQTLKIRNISAPYGREIIVKVVDQVAGYPANRINLHRRAFEALGVNPSVGVINIEIIPSPELEQEKWGKYLLEVTEVAYPNYNVTDYNAIGKTMISSSLVRETFEFVLQSSQETLKVQGNVVYNPTTDRIISFNLQEVQ